MPSLHACREGARGPRAALLPSRQSPWSDVVRPQESEQCIPGIPGACLP